MTENKRFTEIASTGIVIDNITEKEYNCDMRIDDDFLHLINNLAEENKQLKYENDKLIDAIARVQQQAVWTRKENEQLQQQLQGILKLIRKIEDCTHDIKVIGDIE